MAQWANGYVTDVEYTDGFYFAQSPQHLGLAAAFNGFEPPDLRHGFAYCELGCGRGLTSTILAAINPEAEFHAVDFHPGHIAHAQAQSRAAGLNNIQWHERSFDDLTRSNLPMFDVITMHGVWSWIAPDLQKAIVQFVGGHLKPGGLVYVSYNAMPAWALMAPLQRIVKELAAMWPGRSDQSVSKAIMMIGRLAEAKIISPALHEGLKRLTGEPQRQLLPYLAHEYLNDHWKPAYHLDVVRAFSEAKLGFAASTELLRNFSNLALNKEQRDLLSEIPVVELRDTLKDCCADHWFHQDVFVRGRRRMSEARRDTILNAMHLTLISPAPEVIEISRPDQTIWRPDPVAYGMFVKALEQRPYTVAELLSLPRLPVGHGVKPIELVGVLIGTGLAVPFGQVEAKARSSCDRFNQLIEAEGEIALSRTATIAVPSIGAGITLSGGDFDLYLHLRRNVTPDPQEMSSRFVQRCKEDGGHPIVDGKPIEDETEARVAVTRDYATKIERIVPIWRMIGMI